MFFKYLRKNDMCFILFKAAVYFLQCIKVCFWNILGSTFAQMKLVMEQQACSKNIDFC